MYKNNINFTYRRNVKKEYMEFPTVLNYAQLKNQLLKIIHE